MNERADILESFLKHPGWQLFAEHVQHEWGPNGLKYNAELDKALNLTDDNAAASQARQIRAGRRVIEQLLTWPSDELARCKRQEPRVEEPMMARGGYHR